MLKHTYCVWCNMCDFVVNIFGYGDLCVGENVQDNVKDRWNSQRCDRTIFPDKKYCFIAIQVCGRLFVQKIKFLYFNIIIWN